MHVHNRLPLLALLAFWLLAFCVPAALGRVSLPRDISSNQIPWRVTWAAAVGRGEAPLWDPGSSQGRHLLANPNAGAAYPGTLLYLVLSPETAASWHGALHVGIFLVGCYRLGRRSGASRDAAALGAAAALAGVAFSATVFGNTLASLAWAPWAVSRALPPPGDLRTALRRALGAGCFLGLALLAGEPVIAGLTGLTFAVVVAMTWNGPRAAWGVVAAVGAAAALAAPVLVPLVAALPDTLRGTLGTVPGALGADTLRPARFPELGLAHLLGPPFGSADGGFWAAPSFPWTRYLPLLFVGSMPLLTLVGLGRRAPALRPWLVVTGLGVGLSAAMALPFAEGCLRLLPGFSGLRFGIKLLLLPTLATPVVVAAGWRGLRERPGRARRFAAGGLGVLACTLPVVWMPDAVLRPVLARLYPASASRLEAVPSGTLRGGVLTDLAALALPLAAVAVAGPVPTVAVLATVAANTLQAEGVLDRERAALWATKPALARLLPEGARIAALAQHASPVDAPEHGSMGEFWAARAALAPDYGGRWGLAYVLAHGPDGLEPFRQEAIAAAARHLSPGGQARVAVALGADAVIVTLPVEGLECTPLDGIHLCRVARPVPPVYLARRAVPVVGFEATALTLAATGFAPGSDVVVEGLGGAVSLAAGTVSDLGGPPHHRRFSVVGDGPGLLVVGQSFVRGWRARVDGKPMPVLPVNGAQAGVYVPGGAHAVELFLDPVPYRLGLLGPSVLMVVALSTCIRRRPAGPVVLV